MFENYSTDLCIQSEGIRTIVANSLNSRKSEICGWIISVVPVQDREIARGSVLGYLRRMPDGFDILERDESSTPCGTLCLWGTVCVCCCARLWPTTDLHAFTLERDLQGWRKGRLDGSISCGPPGRFRMPSPLQESAENDWCAQVPTLGACATLLTRVIIAFRVPLKLLPVEVDFAQIAGRVA
jgi:hypothetical protein